MLSTSLAGADDGKIPFRRLAAPDDSPVHITSALAQDSRGFLWIGTQGGLVRYDGYEFRLFASRPDDPTSLAGNYVRALLVARDGRLWVGSFSGGLSVLDPATERFTRYRHDPADPRSLIYDRVEGLAEDERGGVWIATSAGLDRLEPSTGRIEHFRHAPDDPTSLADDRARGLLFDRQGRLWVGTRQGLQRLRADGRGFDRVASDPGVDGSLAGDFVERLFEDHRGRIWIGTESSGAAVLDPESGELRRLRPQIEAPEGLAHRWVYGFTEPRPDEVWIATFGGGVDVVDGATFVIRHRLRHDPTLDSTVAGDRVGALLTDRSGIVWVGSWGQGLARHDPSSRAFRPLRASPGDPGGPSHPAVVRARQMRDGRIWAGTNGNGIDVLDHDGRLVGSWRADPADPGALADGSVTAIAEAADGTAWVATLDGSLHLRRPGARRFVRLRPEDGLPGGAIRAIAFGGDGTVWLAGAEGLGAVDPRSLAARAYRTWPGAGAASPAIESLVVESDGSLWVGSDNGLYRFDPATATSIHVAHDPSRPGGLPDNWVPALLRDRDGRLWVGTAAGACVLTDWDGRDIRCESVAERAGFEPRPAETLVEDAAGQVWIGPHLRVDPVRWRARSFETADGIAFRTFYINSGTRIADGRLLFGSPEGLLIVDPAELAPWSFEPPVVLTGFTLDGRPQSGAPILRRLVVPPGSKTLRLDFASLDFTAPERLRYRTRLLGYDDRWTETDAGHRSVSFGRLPPRTYRLEIQGTNRVGVWSPSQVELGIEVLPAFYETGLFRALALIGLAALLHAAYRLRVRQLERRGRELERTVADRTRDLATAHEELQVAYRRIEEASLTDPLTGLRNRRFLEGAIAADLELAARTRQNPARPAGAEGSDLVFLLLDLDHFKSVNDTHGHAAGDAVLVQLSMLLRETFRASDHVVRWGGEEFLVVGRFLDRRRAPELAETVRAAVAAQPFSLPDGTILRKTASIGFASFPFVRTEPRTVGWEEVVHLADLALYAAKKSGRNAWVGIEPASGADRATFERVNAEPERAQEEAGVVVHRSAGLAGSLRWA